MEKKTVYFVNFWSPGTFVADSWTQEVKSDDPKSVVWPERAYAFTMNKRIDVVDGKKVYKGESKQIGPTYYHPESKVENINQVKKNKNATPILVSNMEFNGWKEIIWSRWGNWPQPFDKKKSVVLA